MYNACLLLLKLLYPFASKTFKVLSYCEHKDVWTQLSEQCYTVYITYKNVYQIIRKRQEVHWGPIGLKLLYHLFTHDLDNINVLKARLIIEIT